MKKQDLHQKLILVRVSEKNLKLLNRAALQKRDHLRSEVLEEFCEWGLVRYLNEKKDNRRKTKDEC